MWDSPPGGDSDDEDDDDNDDDDSDTGERRDKWLGCFLLTRGKLSPLFADTECRSDGKEEEVEEDEEEVVEEDEEEVDESVGSSTPTFFGLTAPETSTGNGKLALFGSESTSLRVFLRLTVV